MLGDKIKKYREAKKITQAEIAELLGVSPATVSKYEAGTLEPNIESIKKLSELFDVSIDELKEVFVRILSEMTRTSIKLVYVDKAEYKNNLYKDVCKEYVKDLNREINTVAKSIPNYLSR